MKKMAGIKNEPTMKPIRPETSVEPEAPPICDISRAMLEKATRTPSPAKT